MQDTPKLAGSAPSYSDLIDFANGTASELLDRAVAIVDAKLGPDYAKKNPAFVQAFARILFDEFCVLRAHHGAQLRKSQVAATPQATQQDARFGFKCVNCAEPHSRNLRNVCYCGVGPLCPTCYKTDHARCPK